MGVLLLGWVKMARIFLPLNWQYDAVVEPINEIEGPTVLGAGEVGGSRYG